MIKYIKGNTANLLDASGSGKKLIELLWGDQFRITAGPENGFCTGYARGIHGMVAEEDLNDESLLEFYFIDVGQGDGVLIRTPDNKHILVDGGYRREFQPSKKNAADFVDWKFAKDYQANQIELDVMIASHCDADHYGGLWDLINPKERHELYLKKIAVNNFYHAGVSWWKNTEGKRTIGNTENGLLTTLLEDNAMIDDCLKPDAEWKLQGEWGEFVNLVNKMDIPVSRLFHTHGADIATLPGFNDVLKIHVLGPVAITEDRLTGYKSFGDASQNTNGHSITLRFDYGKFRLLLTGDLNAKAQKLLLECHEGNTLAFQADVTKACHHGSDDCSFEFLQHVNAAATIISSGDSESHDHPRPSIVAASAITGFRQIKDDKLITPLIYSTEISRSYKLGKPIQVDINGGPQSFIDMDKVKVTFKETQSGDLNPKTKSRRARDLYVVGGIVYGLVNVRTNGSKVLCATMNEKDHSWQVKTFKSRF